MRRTSAVLTCLLAVSLSAGAQNAVPVPNIRGPLPTTATSRPFLAAKDNIQPLDLAAHGYVEEEYILSGTANVYEWEDQKAIRVKTANAPYANRILVRRPANVGDFSGTVIVEISNTARSFDWPMMWGYSMDYFMEHGDAWVMVTQPGAIEGLKTFDAARYADLSWANPTPNVSCPGSNNPPAAMETGLRFDILSQTVAALKSTAAARPLSDLHVERVFLTSQSTDLETYINVFHDRMREADGSPLFDGYLIKSPGAPARLNDCSPNLSANDPRRWMSDIDVPVFQVLAQGEVLASYWNRRGDSDAPTGRFRRYEVAAAAHIDSAAYRGFPTPADQIAASGTAQGTPEWPFNVTCTPAIPLQEFPLLKFILNGAFMNLDRWVSNGVKPPRADRITVLNPGTEQASLKLNDLGIAEGGVRSPYSDVPLASYTTNTEGPGVCAEVGATTPLSEAAVIEMHGSMLDYNREARWMSNGMQAAQWVTATDADKLRTDVRR